MIDIATAWLERPVDPYPGEPELARSVAATEPGDRVTTETESRSATVEIGYTRRGPAVTETRSTKDGGVVFWTVRNRFLFVTDRALELMISGHWFLVLEQKGEGGLWVEG